MSELNNYYISKITPIVSNKGTRELQLEFKVHHSKTPTKAISVPMEEYRKYSRPTTQHVVEPDGNVFVCSEIQSYNFRKGSHNRPTKCNMHGTPMGHKFKLGITEEFIHRSQKILDHCRCFCKPATQYEYDKWCYNDCIQHNRPLDDNAKIYKRLTM